MSDRSLAAFHHGFRLLITVNLPHGAKPKALAATTASNHSVVAVSSSLYRTIRRSASSRMER